MDSSLKKLIFDNKVDGRISTHQSMGNVKANYYFHRQVMEDFFELYSENINKDKDLIELGIAESPKDQYYIPVLVDIDLKLEEDDAKDIGKFYNEENIKSVIRIYHQVFDDIIDNITDNNKICVLLEKNPYKVVKGQTTYVKNGFHLHFPYTFMNKNDQKNHLFPRVTELIKQSNIFKHLMEDSSKPLDNGYLNSPWLLYGSSKGPGLEPYLVTKVYDSELDEITLEKAFKHYQIYDSKEQIIKITNVNKFLPRILSIVPYNRSPVLIRQNIISPTRQKIIEERKKEYPKMDISKSLEIVKLMMPMISDDRANDHNDWMTIGWALYNITQGADEGLDIWKEFSDKADDPRGDARYIFEWNNMNKKCYSYSIGTLKYYAKSDSPDLYAKYLDSITEKYIEDSLNGGHTDIAKLLKATYGNEFVCPSIENRLWYQYRDNKWERIDSGVYLRKKIVDEMENKMVEHHQKLWRDFMVASNNNNEGQKAMFTVKIKQLQALKKSLTTNGWINSVMSEAMYEFFDNKFKERLDMNPMIIGFKNGVYDLERNMFRRGRPEDYISKNMPINYIEYSYDDEEVKEVFTFLEKIFPDKSILKYFLDISSDIFEGGNIRKKVYFWLGNGDNGKSVTQQLFENMLGEYQIKFDTNLITGKRPGSGNAHAELARSGGGVRLATLDEPDNDEQINSGIMKKISGDDRFWARDLFEKGKETHEIVPMFKLVFICLAHDTKVSFSNGTSLSIENLKYKDYNSIISWNLKNNFTKTSYHKLIDNGIKNCIKLTLTDGTNITCTPNHKFLLSNGIWKTADELSINNDQIMMGVKGTNIDDIMCNYDYKLKLLDQTLDCNNINDRLKIAAYARILGFTYDYEYKLTIECRNLSDLSNIIDDLNIIKEGDRNISYNTTSMADKKYYIVKLPNNVFKNIEYLSKDNYLPDFITDYNNCPKFILREFLAGYFSMSNIVVYKIDKNIRHNLVYQYINDILIDIFNVKTTLIKNKCIKINTESIKTFINEIGVRYFYKRICRLNVYLSIINYREYNKNNFNIKDYLESTNLLNFYNSKSPFYKLKIIDKTIVDSTHVYDINVDEPFSNFIANGIVSHNCNKLPHIKGSNDKAIWTRVRVIPFESTFVRPGDKTIEVPKTYEEQLLNKIFPMDLDLKKKIPKMAQPFAWILLQHRLKVTSCVEPEKVLIATNMYRMKTDIFRHFIEECIIDDTNSTINLTTIYETYKEWFRQSYPGQTIQNKQDVQNYFENIWGECERSKKWSGHRLRTLKDDMDKDVDTEVEFIIEDGVIELPKM
jgi:phage/plasmid-associated DNA primase